MSKNIKLLRGILSINFVNKANQKNKKFDVSSGFIKTFLFYFMQRIHFIFTSYNI